MYVNMVINMVTIKTIGFIGAVLVINNVLVFPLNAIVDSVLVLAMCAIQINQELTTKKTLVF